MILLVNDASILIDLLKIGLIDQFFQLEYEFHVTDFVMAEVKEDNVDELDALIQVGKLIKNSFRSEDLFQIQLLKAAHRALSVPDCSCVYLSEKLSAILLTGDGALRRIAGKKKIPVHGILWVFDELIKHALISVETAREKLMTLMAANRRLPAAECNKRLARWKNG